MSCDDLPGGDLECRKQCCGTMPLVVVALAGQGAAIGQLQIALRSLQSLDRGLLVHTQHNSLRRRGDVKATTSAALAVKFGSLLSHQDLRAARSILWLRRNRQTYWTSTSPSASASRGPVQRANPCGVGLSSSFRIRLSVVFV